MIIVKLSGGLGNQLFEYSLGRSLSLKHGVPLKLDTSWYGQVPDRPYELDKFKIEAQIAMPEDLDQFKTTSVGKIASILLPYSKRKVVKERSFSFDPEVLQADSEVYLDGYWQSEKYFKEHASSIRKDLTLKQAATGKNAALLKQIASTNAVSLHVRRGDYVSNAATNQFHGTTPLDYYNAATKKIATIISKPHFYIFSDDPTWTKENLKLDYPQTLVTHNGKAAEQDLRLMSHCQHFIIANSTFSWWGAWLAQNSKKTIIAPKNWFRNNRQSDQDLIPKDWLRL